MQSQTPDWQNDSQSNKQQHGIEEQDGFLLQVHFYNLLI